MYQERVDRAAKWLYIKDDQYVHISCGNCAHTVASVDYVNDPDIADYIINKLPKVCPICRMKMIRTKFENENLDKCSRCKWNRYRRCHDHT